MALAATLLTKLEVDNKSFNQKMNESQNSVSNFAKSAMKWTAGVGVALAGLAATGFGVLLSNINETSKEIDNLSETAHKLGLEVEAFQKLSYGAKLAGVDTETLSQGLTKLTRSVGEAMKGSNGASEAFKKLGLSAELLNTLSLDQQYEKIAAAIKKIPNANEQAQLALEIFGRSGVEQLNLLRSNITATNEEFEKLGAGLSEEQAGNVEKYRDSVDKLSTLLGSFWVQLTAAIAPALTRVTEYINEQIIAFGGLGPVAKQVALIMVDAMIGTVKGIQAVMNALSSLKTRFLEAKLAAMAFFQGVGTKGLEKQIAQLSDTVNLRNSKTFTEKGTTDPLLAGLMQTRKDLNEIALPNTSGKQKVEVSILPSIDFTAKVAKSKDIAVVIDARTGRTIENRVAQEASGLR